MVVGFVFTLIHNEKELLNMKNWKLMTLMMAMLLFVLAACGTEKTETAKEIEKSGTSASVFPLKVAQPEGYDEVTLEKKPEKVVVFDYGFLDTLDELGVEVAGVSKQTLPTYLSKYADAKYEDIGGLKEPNFEAIAAMAPDVIFVSGRQVDAYEELKKIAPTVFVGLDNVKYLDSFKANTQLAGKIFGKEAEVEQALKQFDAKLADVQTTAKQVQGKALVLLGSEGELSAYGPGSRFGVIHDVYGLQAADKNIEVSQHGQVVSFEYVLETNPDILFIIDRDAAVTEGPSGTKAAIENDIVNKTNAVKNGQVFYLNPEEWYLSGGGLQSEQKKISSIMEALQ